MEQEPEVKQAYKKLRRRLDRNPVGAPRSPEMFQILKLIFTEAEAEVGALMPIKPTTLETMAQRTGKSQAELEKIIDSMADKGLVMDFYHQKTGKRFFMLSPTVVGFFEFSLMRVRDDLDQKALARLYDSLLFNQNDFVSQAFSGPTQLGRIMAHETALPQAPETEILDYERASVQLQEADGITVSLCYCRHKTSLLDHPCKAPLESCFSLNFGAEYIARNKLGRYIEKAEAMDILAQMRELGTVQTLDNVKEIPTFMCNCCGCCCGMLLAMNRLGLKNTITSSNWIAAMDREKCVGCGLCAKRCPINAIQIKEFGTAEDGEKIKKAVVDESICLGCGVCHVACKKEALSMIPRKQRAITPVTVMERLLLQAIEHGKLQNVLFDDETRWDHYFLRNLTGAIFKLPPVQAILVSDAVKSRFVDAAMQAMGKKTGKA